MRKRAKQRSAFRLAGTGFFLKMLIKIFTLKFSEAIGGFDDEKLRTFMADKEIVSMKERFFIKDNVPYWAFAF
jgi:hypothetical protein